MKSIALHGVFLAIVLLPCGTAFSQEDDAAKEARARIQELEARVGELCKAGKYAEARPLAEEALKVAEERLGPQDRETARCLNDLAALSRATGDLKGAKALFERALAICEKALGPDHPDTATTLNNLALVLKTLGDLRGARPLYERALAIRENTLGSNHPDTANTLNNLAALLKALGDLKGAGQLYERALAIREKALGPDHPETAQSLNNLALLRKALGDLKGARPLYERALAICEKALGPRHPDVAHILHNLAALLKAMGDLKAARPCFERALAIREEALGPDHSDTAASLNGLAFTLKALGDLQGARPLYERALAIREKALGPEHPDTAGSLSNLAGLAQAMGDLRGAAQLYQRALVIREKALGPDHSDTAEILNNLGLVRLELGDPKRARPLLERALTIRERVLGPEHPDTALSLDNLACVLEALGDLQDARPLMERALAIRERALGPDHPDTAGNLINLAHVLQALGDLRGARPHFERALAIREKALGPDHPDTADSLSHLAALLDAMGEWTGARSLHERALAIHERVLGPEHPKTAQSLNNLAYLLQARGDLDGARTLFFRALAIRESALGPDHPQTACGLNNLAYVLKRMGDLRGSRPLYERALAIYETTLGPDHPETAASVNNLAVLLQAMGDLKEARSLYQRAWDVHREQLLTLLPTLSSRERCAMVREHGGRLSTYLAAVAEDPRATYEAALVWKGAALRASSAILRLPANATEEARGLASSLAEARGELAQLAFSPPSPNPGAPSVAELYHATRERVERMERDLAKLVPELATLEFIRVSVADVQAALPTDAGLLDILSNQGNLHAWVVRPEGEVKYVPLGRAEEVETLATAFREALEGSDEARWKESGRALRARLAKVLDEALSGIAVLYYSPDGLLATVPLGLLPDGEGDEPRFLIERCAIRHVNGGAGLVIASKLPPPVGEGLLAIGDVDYDQAEGATGKGRPVDQPVGALSETGQEANAVRERFHAAFPEAPVRLLVGKGATEVALKEQAPMVRIIHTATHGFFDVEHLDVALGLRGAAAPMSKAMASEFLAPEGAGRPSGGGWNPLLLSGLVLAGANRCDGGGGEDGWLSAEELQDLDMRGVELVVLSACETGRGELAAGEGVLGLARALSVAGARGFLLSLWKVPDASTREVMEGFYAGLWDEEPQTAEEALRAVQLRMLTRDREARRFDPKGWGAWVLIR